MKGLPSERPDLISDSEIDWIDVPVSLLSHHVHQALVVMVTIGIPTAAHALTHGRTLEIQQYMSGNEDF